MIGVDLEMLEMFGFQVAAAISHPAEEAQAGEAGKLVRRAAGSAVEAGTLVGSGQLVRRGAERGERREEG